MIRNFLLVGLGGGIGSMLRYASYLLVSSRYFPWPTLLINCLGSFIIGLVLAISVKDDYILQNWKLFLATGICGGFTTFSAFSLENMELLQQGRYLQAGLYISSSIILGIAAAFSGFKLIV